MLKFKVKEDEVNRLDIFLANKIPELSRSFIKKLTLDNKVTVNDQPSEVKRKLKPNDKINVSFDLSSLTTYKPIKLPIIYEDDNCIVINKPPGLLTHSKGIYNPEPTIATFVSKYTNQLEGNRAGIVHRLDRDTSGVIICAKNQKSLEWLQKQFSTRKVKKTYVAIVSGKPKESSAIIDMSISRNPKSPAKFRVHPNGKSAQTEYDSIKSTPHFTELLLTPKTGRTHQLRVHLNHIGNPIVGDKLYNGLESDRLYLHALSLDITLPNMEKHHFEAKLPSEFNNFLKSDNE